MDTLLVTGGTGFLGRAIGTRFKDKFNVVLCGRNNDQNEKVHKSLKCDVVPMDVSNIDSVREFFAIYKPKIVVHAAAIKYVHLAERFPNECIDINVRGSQNVVRVSLESGVKSVIGISTDKANSSRSFYGISKNLMERLFVLSDNQYSTRFMCVRFGNLPWSTGSVFPIWKKMLETTGIVETTGLGMKRFFFRLDDAVDLVDRTIRNMNVLGGKILCPSMKSASISKVLEVFLEEFGGQYIAYEPRQGESFEETLIGYEESLFTRGVSIEGQQYYIIDFKNSVSNGKNWSLHTSNQDELTIEEIRKLVKFDSRSLL